MRHARHAAASMACMHRPCMLRARALRATSIMMHMLPDIRVALYRVVAGSARAHSRGCAPRAAPLYSLQPIPIQLGVNLTNDFKAK
jgi:hypothetical protein